MSRLDHYYSQLLRVFKKKWGTARRDIDVIIAEMDMATEDIGIDAMMEMERLALGVYIVRHDGADASDPPGDAGVVIEGCTVLRDLRGCKWMCSPVWLDTV